MSDSFIFQSAAPEGKSVAGRLIGRYYLAGAEPAAVSKGTYTLLIEVQRTVTINVGSLGEVRSPEGAYAYTGSAFGTSGFSRVDRHYELAGGDRATRHWHIDHLLGHDAAAIRGDVRTIDTNIECAVAAALPAGPHEGFGASDCACRSHLAYEETMADLRPAVTTAHREVTEEGQ